MDSFNSSLTDEQKRLLVYEYVLDTIYKNCCGNGGVCPFCGTALWAEEIEHEKFCVSLLIVRAQSANKNEIEAFLEEIQSE